MAPQLTRPSQQGQPRQAHPGERRLAGGASVRDVRQALVQHGTLKPEIELELLSMFVRNELAAQWTVLLLALIFSLTAMFWAPYLQAATWLVIVVAAKVMLLEMCRRFEATPEGERDLKLWRRRLFIAEAISGTAWAGFALVGFNSVSNATQDYVFSSHVFLFASLIVVLAIRMTFASTVMSILFVGTVPMTLAVVARLVMLEDFFYLALASMAAGVHLYFIFLAKGLHSTALAMLEFRAQKDLLIADLEEAKSISDEARRRAEEANLAKSRFLATMSHELRTPLNAILGFSEVMSHQIMGPLDNEIYRDYADSIHRSGSHLLNLINEILDLSRIEAGRYELHEETVQITDVLEDCHRLLKLRAEKKGVDIVECCDGALPPVWADERALRQVCLNLLSNAVKFTPRGGEIVLTAARLSDGGQFISVRDTGPGIPAHEIPKVMQAFGQGSLAHETAEGGTGLGLPIVKNLIELHGGTFELKSELRKGTEVIVTLPRSRVMTAVPPLQPLGQERHRRIPSASPASAGVANTSIGGPARRPRLVSVANQPVNAA
ncbi:MAG: HAMP domain-containing sensor histidine kinase [Hyphomicrobiaceae bacterium]